MNYNTPQGMVKIVQAKSGKRTVWDVYQYTPAGHLKEIQVCGTKRAAVAFVKSLQKKGGAA